MRRAPRTSVSSICWPREMTSALQSPRDSLQCRTAPVLAGAVCGYRPLQGRRKPNRCERDGVRDQGFSIQPQPQTSTLSARDSGGDTLRGFQPLGFRPGVVRQSCRRTANRATVGTSRGSGVLCNLSLSRMGLAEQSLSDALQATTTGLRHRQMPYRGGNPHFKILIQNQSLTISKAQANYGENP